MKLKKSHRRPPISDMRDHFAGSNLQGRQQRLGAMANVFVGPGARLLGTQRQQGLGPIQRLNTGLFVHAQHECILRWVQIQADYVQ